MKVDLQIGGYRLRLDESEDLNSIAWPLSPFEPFLTTSAEPPDIDLAIKVVTQLPDFPHEELIFDASHGLWKLYSLSSGYLLESADTHSLAPHTRSIISEDFSRIEAWVCEHHSEQGDGWVPMQIINPLVEVCLVTKLAREGGLLLHAAGVLMEAGAWAFTGSSGTGKSTLSDFFATRGACVLSDERIIIRKVEDGFAVYGTPWVGASRHANNRVGSLTGLYCIRHGVGSHRVQRMPARKLSPFLLQQCFLPHWDRDAMDQTLTFLSELIDRVDCFDLAFVNQSDIVEYLQEQSQARALMAS